MKSKKLIEWPSLQSVAGFTITFRSGSKEKFYYFDRQTQIQIALLAGFMFLWILFSTATTLSNLFFSDPFGNENLQADKNSLGRLIEERNYLRSENNNLNEQLHESLKLVLQKETQIIELKKSLHENQGFSGYEYASYETEKDNNLSERSINEQSDKIIATLLEALQSTTIQLKSSESSLNKLELEFEKHRTKTRLENAQANLVLSQLNQSINLAVNDLDSFLNKLDISSSNWNREIKSLYKGVSENFEVELMDKTISDSLPIYRIATELENSLNAINTRRLVIAGLPFARPLNGNYHMSDDYGMRKHPVYKDRRMHHGEDYSAPYGTNVHSTGYGKVEFAGTKVGYGRMVIIEHLSGVRSVYAHLSKINVKKGERVALKQVIGEVGSTGVSTGNHLHYEIRLNKTAVNPEKFKV